MANINEYICPSIIPLITEGITNGAKIIDILSQMLSVIKVVLIDSRIVVIFIIKNITIR